MSPARPRAREGEQLLADDRDVLARGVARRGVHAAPDVDAGAGPDIVARTEVAEARARVDAELGAPALADVPDVAVAEDRGEVAVVQGPTDLGRGRWIAARDAGQI